MASVAEVKAAIDAAMQQVTEGQAAVHAANEKLGEAQMTLAAAVEGSGHEAVSVAQAALAQTATDLEQAMATSMMAMEQAQTYSATL